MPLDFAENLIIEQFRNEQRTELQIPNFRVKCVNKI